MELPHHHAHRHRHSARGMGQQHTGAATRASLVERSQHLMPRASCSSDSDAGCTKPTVVPKLAIVLAVIVPIVVALVVLFFLHRRNQRKLREEDANDKYKSMDFGVDLGSGGKRRPAPEMALADAEKTIRSDGRPKQMSMDMDVTNPYILPAGLHGSRESFHSLSRNGDSHDPYRPVTFIKDSSSIRSASRSEHRAYRHDNGSMYTTSSGGTERKGMNDSLIKNAQRMSQSVPLTAPPHEKSNAEPKFPEPIAVPLGPMNGRPSRNNSLPPPPPPPPPPSAPAAEAAQSPNSYVAYSPSLPSEPLAAPSSKSDLPPVQEAKSPAKSSPSPPPRVQSLEAVVQNNANTTSFMSTSSYGDGFQVTPPSRPESNAEPTPLIAPQPRRQSGLIVEEQATNRLSMSLRPLPPDNPEDTAEQRANRIRSFYKEYFDDSKPEPAGTYNDYYEDYSSEYLDGAIFDPDSGAFVVTQPNAPFAEPVTRRAMTPPPRAPPRFRSNTGPRGPGPFSGRSSAASSGRFMPPPRGMSSMSGRLPQPVKPRAPPTPLSSLPTPAKLTEDAFTINPADFAPPVSFRERQNGRRPDSPLGNARPYSPSVRPHTPLASSFDDLMVMPSPHALRKSGLFTGLDFAPPPRFRDPGSGASDAGSIRSNRSGMSAAGRMAIRNGANRVSRLPPGAVGTKDAMLQQLRPKMALTTPA